MDPGTILAFLMLGGLIALAVYIIGGSKRREVKALQAAIDAMPVPVEAAAGGGLPPGALKPSGSRIETAIVAIENTKGEWRVEERSDTRVVIVRKHMVPHFGFLIFTLLTGLIGGIIWIVDASRNRWRYRFRIMLGADGRAEITRL